MIWLHGTFADNLRADPRHREPALDQRLLPETAICDKLITPPLRQAGWRPMDQIYREFPLVVGRTVARVTTVRHLCANLRERLTEQRPHHTLHATVLAELASA